MKADLSELPEFLLKLNYFIISCEDFVLEEFLQAFVFCFQENLLSLQVLLEFLGEQVKLHVLLKVFLWYTNTQRVEESLLLTKLPDLVHKALKLVWIDLLLNETLLLNDLINVSVHHVHFFTNLLVIVHLLH